MSTSLQFGLSYRAWWFMGLIVLAVGLVIAGCCLFVGQQPAGTWLLLGGAVAAISAVMSGLLIARGRFQLEVTPQGFVIRDRSGEREFDDSQLICAGLSYRTNYSNGIAKSTTRTFDLWVEGSQQPEQFLLKSKLPIRSTDPLAAFIERVESVLHDRAAATLQAGEAFEGEGWTLHHDELVVRAGRQAQTVHTADLSAVEVFDDHLCVWQFGQDEPVLRIPVSSANTRVLQQLLSERIVPREKNVESGDGLGRILFERKPDSSTRALVWLLPILAGLLLPAVGALAWFQVRGGVLVGLAVFGLTVLVWGLVLSQSVEFRVCENGIRRKWLFRIRQVRFTEIESLTYSAIRQYVKGSYVGTHFSLTFASLQGGKWQKLTYSKTLRNADAELDRLRDRVSALIGNRLYESFREHRTIAWTDHLRFLPEGLEYASSGFFGRKAPFLIPYSQIYGYDADAGVFSLWVHGQKKPVAKENVNQPNFFPGYHVLARLLLDDPAGIETSATRL